MNQPVIERCPCALRWPIHSERDNYCGFCGRRLRTLEVVLVDHADESARYMGSEVVQADFRVRNTGVIPLPVMGLDWVSPLMPKDQTSAAQLERSLVLEPGIEQVVSFRIKMPERAKTMRSISVRLRTTSRADAGGDIRIEPTEIPLQPPPRIDVFWKSDSRTLPVESLEAGIIVPLVALERDIILAENHNLFLISDDQKQKIPIYKNQISVRILKANQAVPIRITDIEPLFSNDRRERDVYMEVQAQGLASPLRTGLFTLRQQLPTDFDLQIELISGLKPRVLKGYRRAFDLVMMNRTRRIFTVEQITVDLPEHLRNAGFRVQLDLKNPPPFFVEKVQRSLERIELGKIVLDAENWKGGGEASEIRIHVAVENCAVQSSIIPIDIVVPKPEYDLPLGIDFGNTNTDAAQLNNLFMPVMVPLPPLVKWLAGSSQPDPHVIPTMVQYQPAGEYRTDWDAKAVQVKEVGGPAYDHLKQDPAIGIRIVSMFKPKIGLEQRHRFPLMPNVKDKTLDSVVSDYLQHVLLTVEEETGLSHKKVVLSHPVRFWTTQRNALRTALMRAVQNLHHSPEEWAIHFIDEATAVILYDTFTRNQSEDSEGDIDFASESDVILVFDFGGGTIDLTLCEIEKDAESESWIVRHLDFDGTSHYGGEQITEMIAEILYRYARNVANQRQDPIPTALEINRQERNPLLDLTHAADPVLIPYGRWDEYHNRWGNLTQPAVRNYINLYFYAEDIKLRLLSQKTQTGDTWIPTQILELSLYTVRADAPGEKPSELKINALDPFKETALATLVLQWLEGPMNMVRAMIHTFNERMKKTNRPERKLTKILMTGQSSRMPLVQNRLREVAQEANGGNPVEVRALDRIKEAVAMGAALYGAQAEMTQLELNRASRVYIFLKRSVGVPGASAFIPVVKRLDPLPAAMTCYPQRKRPGPYYPLRLGRSIKIIESFVDLSDLREAARAEENKDYRILAEISVTPKHWNEEQVQQARLQLTFSEDEQLTASLIPDEELNENAENQRRLEPYILWPK